MSTNEQFPVLLNVTFNEGENHCYIKADITGFHARNVSVTPLDNSLVVEMKSEHEAGESFYMGEIEPMSCRRVIPLGFQINQKQVRTHYQDGKLDICVVKDVSTGPVDSTVSASHN